jgi:hypothetical protein
MVAVRSPVLVVVTYGDNRIEKPPDRLDDAHQTLDVRVRRIALIWRRLHPIDRQRDEQQWRAAERVVVPAQDSAPVGFDLRRQGVNRGGFDVAGFGGAQANRCGRRFLAANRLLARRHPAMIRRSWPVDGMATWALKGQHNHSD